MGDFKGLPATTHPPIPTPPRPSVGNGAHSPTSGRLYYGDPLAFDSASVGNIGLVGRIGRIQCAILHLAAGMVWNNGGIEKKAPDVGGVANVPSPLRKEERHMARQSEGHMNTQSDADPLVAKAMAAIPLTLTTIWHTAQLFSSCLSRYRNYEMSISDSPTYGR